MAGTSATDGALSPVYLDVVDVSELLRKSQRWVVTEARSGRLPSTKLGRDYRFTPAGLDSYLESRKVATA